MNRSFAIVLGILVLPSVVTSCENREAKAAMLTGGDPRRGKEELRHHGCSSCHTIPGVPGATTLVGPPLDRIARRAYIAGSLPNTPENMREWIAHPQRVKPNNAMPEVPMTDEDARDMTAFLYTLD